MRAAKQAAGESWSGLSMDEVRRRCGSRRSHAPPATLFYTPSDASVVGVCGFLWLARSQKRKLIADVDAGRNSPRLAVHHRRPRAAACRASPHARTAFLPTRGWKLDRAFVVMCCTVQSPSRTISQPRSAARTLSMSPQQRAPPANTGTPPSLSSVQGLGSKMGMGWGPPPSANGNGSGANGGNGGPSPKLKPPSGGPLLDRITSKLRALSHSAAGQDPARLFRYYDRENSGDLELPAFTMAIRKGIELTEDDISDSDLATLFGATDIDGDGAVSIDALTQFVWGYSGSGNIGGSPAQEAVPPPLQPAVVSPGRPLDIKLVGGTRALSVLRGADEEDEQPEPEPEPETARLSRGRSQTAGAFSIAAVDGDDQSSGSAASRSVSFERGGSVSYDYDTSPKDSRERKQRTLSKSASRSATLDNHHFELHSLLLNVIECLTLKLLNCCLSWKLEGGAKVVKSKNWYIEHGYISFSNEDLPREVRIDRYR